ncbi:MAG: site-specific tyrosine recombinase/integron integrase [Bacilli bacterium]
MQNEIIPKVLNEMVIDLNSQQLKKLKEVLQKTLYNLRIEKLYETENKNSINNSLLDSFISSKRVEGCSKKTINYYKYTLTNIFNNVNKEILHLTTDDIRGYLDNYQKDSKATKITVDNIRRVLSTFFKWLEEEDYIVKNPVKKIHKIRTGKAVKETLSDESIELLRDNCNNLRDLAIIDLLISSGIRVGELVNLNISDINFSSRECIVFGKGDKERKAYFDAKTKLHLEEYILSRSDNNEALFVHLKKPHNRLNISGIEIIVRKLDQKLKIEKVHPHKFRRTLATKAIDKGMPIEQVQHMLGHTKVDTTLQYAMVEQNNVKIAHRKFLS